MAPTPRSSLRRPTSGRPGLRRVAVAVAGLAVAALVSGCATPYTSSQPGRPYSTGASRGREIIIVCESGNQTDGAGVSTSSSVALRVPTGTTVPEGCRLG